MGTVVLFVSVNDCGTGATQHLGSAHLCSSGSGAASTAAPKR